MAIENSDNEPVLVLGDFNTPSHLDWVESAKSLHCDWTYVWPVTRMLLDAGLKVEGQ